jgi:hypothetical protein
MMKKLCCFLLPACIASSLYAQQVQVTPTPDQIKAITPSWKGDRFADGRPKTSDRFLERLKNVALEEAWGYLRNKGYQNQFEGEWTVIRPDSVMTGRVVTAQYMPMRPDYDSLIRTRAKAKGVLAIRTHGR